MNYGVPLSLVFLSILALSLGSANDTLVTLLVCNAVAQLILFVLVACIPFLRTGRMSFVDIAWPFGVALIGLQILLFGDGDLLRRSVVGCIYLLIGLRMGFGALVMARATGVIFKREFPRYAYRRMILEQNGNRKVTFHMLSEIMLQGFANMSVLAIPGFIMATNQSTSFSVWEIAGVIIWISAYALEMTADMQKLKFVQRNRGGVCNVGLWRYSRHPNYFSEWLVWTGLVIACMSSWLALQGSETMLVWSVLGIGAAAASAMLYVTLVYLTGAIPAEYYSLRKRPDYAEYQHCTNMFFPWFPKKGLQ